ncbi:L-asparaginase isoform X2 [Leptinotarsa decemlineata]|uniref:L-asparaginase isoform X2 n=1 Tax=Leptinotarsa decemlineata TaxID=7539 RepID=UPI003D30A4CF
MTHRFALGKYRKVLVLYVGGTIGMQRNNEGVFIPVPNTFLQKLKEDSEMHDPLHASKYFRDCKENELVLPSSYGHDTIIYQIIEYTPLLDSSNMTSKDWIRIARDIKLHYDTFDGFIVLHGTDTLAYTSSALSFMFDSLKKPVVITGAQIPIFERRADAKENFLTSLIIAAYYDIPEVCVFFANKLFRGNRIVKVSSNELDAFSSPNYHTLADIGVDVKVNHHYIRKTDDSIPFKLFDDLNQNVAMLTLFPTITCEMLNSFLECSLKGIVIQSYGSGNIPSKRNDLLSVFKKAVEKEMLIVNITQCSRGSVHASYEPGKVFKDIGIICGRDMTAEAALTKLAYVLALPGLSFQQRVQMMKTDLRGEMSVNVEDF